MDTDPPEERPRRARTIKRQIYLLEAARSSVPRGDERGPMWLNGRAQHIEFRRTTTSIELLEIINSKYESGGINLRSVPWEFVTIQRNRLVPHPHAVSGDKLLNRMYARQSVCVYIRKRGQQTEPPLPHPQPQAANPPEQGPENGEMDIVEIDNEPAPPAQNGPGDGDQGTHFAEFTETVEERVFEDAQELGMITPTIPPLDMLEGLSGPHVAALLTAEAGIGRPWPSPLSLQAAKDICSRQQRPLVTMLGLTESTIGTSIERYTRTENFLKYLKNNALCIHLLPDMKEGKDFMSQHNIMAEELPALVFEWVAERSAVIAKSRDDGMMQGNVDDLQRRLTGFGGNSASNPTNPGVTGAREDGGSRVDPGVTGARGDGGSRVDPGVTGARGVGGSRVNSGVTGAHGFGGRPVNPWVGGSRGVDARGNLGRNLAGGAHRLWGAPMLPRAQVVGRHFRPFGPGQRYHPFSRMPPMMMMMRYPVVPRPRGPHNL